MTLEEVLKRIEFEKNWLYDCGIFGSDVDIAFHAIKKKVIEALDQESVIDKIREEIETERNAGCHTQYAGGLDFALSIIDKYKAESEVAE